jgi:hypothetical protein
VSPVAVVAAAAVAVLVIMGTSASASERMKEVYGDQMNFTFIRRGIIGFASPLCTIAMR